MSAGHSPLPWFLDESGNLEGPGGHHLNVKSPWIEDAWYDDGPGEAEARANMALIVQAVNAHDALLAACEAQLTALDSCVRYFLGKGPQPDPEVIGRAVGGTYAAIALARGGK